MDIARRLAALALAASTLAGATPNVARSQGEPTTAISSKPRAGYAMVNGLRMYYEIHGTRTSARPLVLLHGGGSTIGTNFSRVIPLLKPSRQVIAVEFQAHGHTKDIDRPFTFEQSAEDVASLLQQLHIAQADVLGFSNGGTTALQLAIRHPELVGRLIVASANYKRSGMQEGFWPAMEKGSFADMPQPYKDALRKIDPSPAAVMAMYKRDSERMLAFRDIADSSIQSIKVPTLVVVGDRDVIRVEHGVELSRLLPHGRLLVLPSAHGEYLGEVSFPNVDDRVPRAFVNLAIDFLSAAESEAHHR
jgi:pimeloyl-ACP methyl ester carboxylesterase